MQNFTVTHHNSHKTVQQIPDMKEILSYKCFSENKWWWLRDFGRNRGRDEKNLEWQDETGEEQDPTRWGAWEAVCSAAWLTHNRSATARAPPRVWRNRAQYAPTVSRQIHLFRRTKMTGRNTQKDINTQRHTARKESKVLYGCHVRAISESERGEVCIYVSAAGKLTDSFHAWKNK